MITYQQYMQVLEDHPWVNSFDCGACHQIVFAEVAAAYEFLLRCPKQQKQFRRRSTYSLKNDVEGILQTHLTERAYIVAAILAGFDVWTKGTNANINIAAGSKTYQTLLAQTV